MNQYPKISIITPTFNQGDYIERTILSVINQNYPNLEFIIIDGGSTDKTVEIIKKYEKSISFWSSAKDRGQSEAINKGLKTATGEIINWINSDDYLEENVLHKIAAEFNKKGVDVVCGYSNLLYSTHEIKKRTSGKEHNLGLYISECHIMQPSTFFRKKIFDQFSPLSEKLHFMMDHYLWLQYVCCYGLLNVSYVDYTIAHVLMQG